MGAGVQMSLNMSTLKENLVQAFQSMKDGDDAAFAKKVSEAVANHIKTGQITTVDAGSCGSVYGSRNRHYDSGRLDS